jgi:protein required for attachment to host cells
MDFPGGKHNYTDRDTDQAGRFAGSKNQAGGIGAPGKGGRVGMSIDERLPMQREESRRRAKELAAEIEHFLNGRPNASWDFAAGPELNGTVLEIISPALRQRLRRSVSKDLVNHRVDEVRAHFAGI